MCGRDTRYVGDYSYRRLLWVYLEKGEKYLAHDPENDHDNAVQKL